MAIYSPKQLWKEYVMTEPVYIIGIGADGLTGLGETALNKIHQADQLWGSERLLALLPPGACEKTVILGKHLSDTLQKLGTRSADDQIVILASGDPGFFGVAASVLKILPLEEIQVLPAVSSLQTAFARIKVPWSDAVLTSAHARPVSEIIGLARRHPKVGILTDPEHSPSQIASRLLAAGIADCRTVVFEALGEADENITDTRLAHLAEMTFGPLNVLLLLQDPGWGPATLLPFRPDSAYRHKNGLITKSDVRLIDIGRMQLRETDIAWDIGAGSGAVSIEMAEIAWHGRVYAIEKEDECLECLRENVARYGVMNVEIIPGNAPQVLDSLPSPDVVFIGGSSGRLETIFEAVEQSARAGCRVVANFAILENMLLAQHWMQKHGWNPLLTEAHFSYGASIADGTRLVPHNPIYILSGIVQCKEDL
jgi:precorrin-6B C5,15-methyltransferase / cobalt-precorrin-6B C5,C15-methyltransferase